MTSLIQHYPLNERGRDFVVGDIHGCFQKLRDGLAAISFDPYNDRLFSVGDLVDRGPESKQSIEWLIKPWFHAVRGNHEQMAIGVAHGKHDRDNYIQNGGAWFVSLIHSQQMQYADAFDALPVAIDIQTHNGLIGIVHAECPCANWGALVVELENISYSSNRLKNHLLETCLWSRTRKTNFDCSDIAGIDQLIVGHTPVDEDQFLGNVHYIDTGAVFGRKLTIIQIQ